MAMMTTKKAAQPKQPAAQVPPPQPVAAMQPAPPPLDHARGF